MESAKRLEEVFEEIMDEEDDTALKLIDQGIDPNEFDISGHTSLSVAVINERFELANELIKRGADVNALDDDKTECPLFRVAEYGTPAGIKYLIDNGTDLAREISDSSNAISFLTASAATGENVEPDRMAALLIDAGVDPDPVHSDMTTPLMFAVNGGPAKLAKVLLQNGANPNRDSTEGFPLCITAVRNDLRTLKLLINFGARVDFRDEDGDSVLDCAAGYSGLQPNRVIRHLLENHRRVFSRSDIDRALCVACQQGTAQSVGLLSEYGANPNSRDGDGNTALRLAVGNTEEPVAIMIKLLTHGADANAPVAMGQTPLMAAVLIGAKREVIRTLLRYGADPRRKDNAGHTVFDYQPDSEVEGLDFDAGGYIRSVLSPPRY